MDLTMTKNNRTTSYIFTADPLSATDMQQIEIVKKTVRVGNRLAMQNYKWACARAEYNGLPMPKKPATYRVRLMGRGPRRINAKANGLHRTAYDSCLPQRYATRFDIYVHEVR